MKKLLSIILSVSLVLSVFCGLTFQVASAETLWGIDVSFYQGTIDWNKVKAAGVDFAILRAGYEYTKDSKFEEYYAGAKAAGIPVGVYLYTYADNVDEATKEANALLSFLEGKTFEWPIYIDVEESAKYSQYSKDFVSNLVLTELEILEAAGYFCGVYTYTYFAKNYINMSLLSAYTTWIAEYSSTCSYAGAYDMWQYSSDLTVSGITANTVDTNYCYVDFEPIIKAGGFNGFPPAEPTDPSVILPFDSTSGFTTYFATSTGINATEKTEGYSSLKMTFTNPVGQNSNVGGMLVYDFASAKDLSEYSKFTFDLYSPVALSNGGTFQINFVTSTTAQDGYNFDFKITDLSAGWTTFTIDKSSPNATANSPDWSNINRIRLTWFNNSQISADYFLLDNLRIAEEEDDDSSSDTSSEIVTGVYGDVDGDSVITIADALTVLHVSVEKLSLTEGQMALADVNGDSLVNVEDALLLLQLTIGKITSLPMDNAA